eukprot:TRINITY_DN5397_c0_g1_i1.p1 TRINITY_DN5397_c0_g1~~TRINITY_DN5397_c0_g1_i1.p1  ORF type:complete len:219 (-),score=65.77 TRINITY_DN5397_c0_g1_i1:35-691(-)
MKCWILLIFLQSLLMTSCFADSESPIQVSAPQEAEIEINKENRNETQMEEKKPFQRVTGQVTDLQLKSLIEELHDSFMLVKFYSTWCPWSVQYAPIYESMIETFPNVSVVELDASKYPSLNWKYSVSALPRTILFFNSTHHVRFPGSDRSYEKVRDFVQEKTKENPVAIKTIPQLLPLEESADTDWMLVFSCFFVISTRFLPFIWNLFKPKPPRAHQE